MNFRLSPILLGCMVAFLPLYIRITSVNVERISKANALLCLLPILISMFGITLRKFPEVLKAIFIAAMFHVVIFQYEPASTNGIYQSIAICLGLLFVIKYHESADHFDIDYVLDFLCIGALVQSALVVTQLFGFDLYTDLICLFDNKLIIDGSFVDGHYAIFGSLQNPNVFGAYQALCLPAFFRSKKLMAWSLVVIATIILAGSRMPMAAACFSILYYLAVNNKIKEYALYISFTVAFYAFCFLLPDHTSDRMIIWGDFLSKVDLKHFLIGGSPSWLSFHVTRIGKSYATNLHNEYLSIFNIYGILGLIAVGYLFHLVIKNQSKNKVFGAIMVGAFVNMHGNFPLHIAPTCLIIMLALAHSLKGSYGINMDR